MIDYIIYSEFDINAGSVVKIEYPKKTEIKEMTHSSYIIKEGINNLINNKY